MFALPLSVTNSLGLPVPALLQIPLPVTVIVVAFLLDMGLGEFPRRIHPVVLFGRMIGHFDRSWSRPDLVGIPLAIGAPLFAAGVFAWVTTLAFQFESLAGIVVAGLLLFATISLRSLLAVATDVIALADADVRQARTEVRALVGRDAETLSPGEIRSATVESAAENLADGLVGPLLAFAIVSHLSIPGGVAAAAFVKATNTLDSMLGYRTKPVGRASAKLDDLVMWIPARVTAWVLAIVALDPGSLRRARTWAGEPSSPNSGWPMATMAAIGDVRLAKPGAYVLNPTADLPTTGRARSCVRTVGVAGVGAFLLSGVIAWV